MAKAIKKASPKAAAKSKVSQFTLYRAKVKDQVVKNYIKTGYVEKIEEFASSTPGLGPLYLMKHTPKTPKWLQRLAATFSVTDLDARTVTLQGGCIFVTTPVASYAACFGHGHIILNLEKFEANFGHHVSMNIISANALSELILASPGDVSTSRLIQSSKPTKAMNFEIHQARDLLRQVVGKVGDNSIAERASGTSGLRLATMVQPADLLGLCTKLEPHFKSPDFKKLGILTFIEPVKSKKEIEDLEKIVAAKFTKGEYNDFTISFPEIVDFLDNAFEVKFGSKHHECSAFEIPEEILEKLKGADEVIEMLKKDLKLMAISLSNDSVKKGWSLFRCLNAELKVANRLIILLHGQFFSINETFAASVEKVVSEATLPPETIPIAYEYHVVIKDKSKVAVGADELQYNSAIREALHTSTEPAHLLDQLNIWYNDISPVEFCDVLHSKAGNLRLIHTKIINGGYGSISHETRQAVNGLQIYLTKPRYREVLRQQLQKCLTDDGGFYEKDGTKYLRVKDPIIPQLVSSAPGPPDRKNLELVMALVNLNRLTKPDRSRLPFFAKLSIYDAIERANSMGVNLKVIFPEIKELTGAPPSV